ncbi:sulfur carrier protein ThiS [Sulfurospirillum diekertiae]|uniref:Sulfur carrier protein ThiS n=1 Tax=Sulfurospirillum diekertiae TaxID=1854492 RepID=A0A290HZR1_9BACT|nr:sulfur carrier protein ThiS [Sulfurospirillum diekertiae]ATB70849.1 ThiS, thiamine-biosynthesis protein [Sulfurospirillum diekertiae]QIR75917.1 sulfur carrier protein ThiS [Sulfurospirillum diekertiae]QIR78559.1 sulfur carrier protein ThiS [Sulfurospirillum diekertiae]
MKLTINGDSKEIKDGIVLSELLIIENVEQPDMVSVQLNDEFLTKDEYPTTTLKEGDAINFLYFMGGGA